MGILPVAAEVIPNLMFSVKVKNAAERAGVQLMSPRNDRQFQDALKAHPVMMLVDVQAALPWSAWIREAKTVWGEAIKISAFGGHAEVEKKDQALKAGAGQYVVRSEFEAVLPALMDWAATPHGTKAEDEPPPPLVRRGIALFNEGKFFEQHEVLELAWKAEHRPVRDVYQGMILIGVGCYQIQRRNAEGAEKQLRSGLALLEGAGSPCQGVDIKTLAEDGRRLLTEVRRLGAGGLEEIRPDRFPRISVTIDL